jgi:hypothetical protein
MAPAYEAGGGRRPYAVLRIATLRTAVRRRWAW